MRGIGRPQKIDRQEMIGAVAATRRWMTMNHEERLAVTESRTQVIIDAVKGIEGVSAVMLENIIGHQPFGLDLRVDPSVTGMTAADVVEKLKAGDPPIWTRVRDWEDCITIHTFGLSEGEEYLVGERIAELFG